MASEKTAELANNALSAFQSKLEARSAQVGVVGLGYVGLPLGLLFARKGFRTAGFDIDLSKIEMLLRGESYIRHLPHAAVAQQVEKRHFQPTADFTRLQAMDAIVICVPTPLDSHREPDLTYIRSTTQSVSANLRRGQLVVLESTTYPGTTEEEVLPILEKSGLHCPISSYTTDGSMIERSENSETDFFLAFSPEREDPGNKEVESHQVPKVIGGVNGPSALAGQALYKQAFDRTVLVSSARVAEMTKLLENIYRCVNIALVNELKLLCLRMGIDIWEVIEAAKTKPFGFTPFYPGPGLGGHCIPIDPFYLTWKAREYEFPTRFIELAGEVNAAMPEHVAAAVGQALDQRDRCLKGSRILVLGIAYKKDVDDVRESPALRIMELLLQRGARVDYHDPYIPRTHKMRNYDFQLASIELTPQALGRYDAVLIVTDHSSIDYAGVVRHSRLVIDTRNATRDVTEHRDKIVRC
jgi:UDP-N-acetyl-D-glucosamine dehydrogenase